MATQQGRVITRNGVQGRVVMVAPKAGYPRFVPLHYKKPITK